MLKHSSFTIMLANLASWCERQSTGTIKRWSDSQIAFEFILNPVSRPDLPDQFKQELLIFVASKSPPAQFKKQLDATLDIQLQSVDLPKLRGEGAQNRPDLVYPPSSTCCRVFMPAADFQLRKILASNRFHKAKSSQMLAHKCLGQKSVQTKFTQRSTALDTNTLKHPEPPFCPVACTGESGYIIEFVTHHEWPVEMAIESRVQIFNSLYPDISSSGNQSADRELVENLVARIDGKTVGSISLNFFNCQETSHTASPSATSSPSQILQSSDSSVGIFDLFVEQEYRRQGIGSRLVKTALEYCTKQPAMHVGLICDSELQRFYERLGFTMVGVLEEWVRID